MFYIWEKKKKSMVLPIQHFLEPLVSSRFLTKIPQHKKMAPRLVEEERYDALVEKARLLSEQF